ncbi:hypothetical protein NQ318_012867 [Aromia moschata]|uniref:Uncharacterized protein n=1 Tax=Aromia moschata TaxID=1265417 RepID=A0AAV8YE41_9CUCU|nr:hypothetical protein NQ318_012867 [Aromia moschata]
MTSLTLTLDNIDVSESTEQISKLFPKCRPRSDINLNPIIASGETMKRDLFPEPFQSVEKVEKFLIGEDGEKKGQKSPMRQGVWELRGRSETKKLRNSRDYTETVFSSEVCSVAHEKQNDEVPVEKSSPVDMTYPGEVVVFDDIGGDLAHRRREENR